MSLPYQTRRFWSVVLGSAALRISVVDSHNDEHYAIVPVDGRGAKTRALKYHVLEQLARHVDQGFEAGEVEVNLEVPKEVV